MRPVFAIATLMPALLLALAMLLGGLWPILAALAMTALVAGLDRLVRGAIDADPNVSAGAEFPSGDGLAIGLGVLQPMLLVGGVLALSGDALGMAQKVWLFLALGLWIGQVGNSNAHELIHRPRRMMRRLGILNFTAILYGHHASAHPLVHHVHVATPADPASAPIGRSYWAYLPHAWIGAFRSGHRAEAARLRARHGARWRRHDPYLAYIGGGLLSCGLATAIAGPGGLAWFLAICGHAQAQLLLSDYVQHYGLRRGTLPSGRPEPVGPRHSWNAPHWYSAALMLNAARHSDHHAHPARPYPALRLPAGIPMLPRSLPVMAMLAMWPPVWRRVMDRRARQWQPGGSMPLDHAA